MLKRCLHHTHPTRLSLMGSIQKYSNYYRFIDLRWNCAYKYEFLVLSIRQSSSLKYRPLTLQCPVQTVCPRSIGTSRYWLNLFSSFAMKTYLRLYMEVKCTFCNVSFCPYANTFYVRKMVNCLQIISTSYSVMNIFLTYEGIFGLWKILLLRD